MGKPREPETTAKVLEEFLRRERSSILEDWLKASERVRRGSADSQDSADHLPRLLDAIVASIGEGDTHQLSDFVELHARNRLDAGFSLEEVVREFAMLRELVLDRWKHQHPQRSSALLNRTFDDAMATSASRYTQVRKRTFDALDRISRAAIEIEDIDELLHALLTVAVDSTDSTDVGAIFLRQGELLRLRATVGLEKDIERGLYMKTGEGFPGKVAELKKPLEIRHAARDPIIVSDSIRESGLRALYGLPLLRRGEVIGVAEFGSMTAWEFSDTEKLLFRNLVERAASVISYQWLNEELEASRQRIETVAELLPAGVFVSDEHGKIVLVNPGARKIWGPEVEKALGTDDDTLMRARRVDSGEYVSGNDRAIRRALLKGETIRNEALEIVDRDGVRRFLLSSAAPMRADDGRILGAVEVHADVTEIRRRENELRFLSNVSLALSKSLDLNRTFEQIARLAIPDLADWCAIDLLELRNEEDGTDRIEGGDLHRVAFAHVDPELEALGHEIAERWPPREHLNAMSKRVLLAGEEKLLPRITEEMIRDLAYNEEHFEALKRFRFSSFLSVPLKVHDTFVGAISMATGPTSRRFDETDLRVARELAWRAAIAIENAWLYKKAQDAIHSRDELWGIAAHELRNPLTALRLQISSALRQANAGPDGAQRVRERLTVAERQVNRLVELTKELLDTTRARAGKLDVHPERMNLAATIRELIERNRDQIDSEGVEVVCDLDDDLVGYWDPLRLEQVITNLLTNALKYGRGRPIHMRLKRRGKMARLEVHDQGIGISEEDQERVFRPFERARGVRRITGLGLGLYVSRNIVEAHRGRMSVNSKPGVGSVFTVELPLEPPEEPSDGVG